MIAAYLRKLVLEIVFLGLFFAIAGSITSRLLMIYGPRKSNRDVSFWNIEWNQYFQLELLWFATAAFAHIFFEFTGLNKWYITNGATLLRMGN